MRQWFLVIGAVATGTITAGGFANAGNLVQNGGFEAVAPAAQAGLSATGAARLSDAVGWTFSPWAYGSVFASDLLTNSAKYGFYGYYGVSQNYGPSLLQYTNALGTDPNGGNFAAIDGDRYGGVLSQSISGLTPGQTYTLTFYQASDHYQGWNDTQSSTWTVTLGDQTQSAPTMTNVAGSPNPWTEVTMSFTATSATELLSFANLGGGAPPFGLLDGVSLTATGVAEPVSWALMTLGIGAVGLLARRRSGKADASKA